MGEDGSCPSCGDVLETPKLAAAAATVAERRPARPVPKAPWHFKVLLGSLAIYLGYRAFQGVAWVAERI
jgi:hypothetical protein